MMRPSKRARGRVGRSFLSNLFVICLAIFDVCSKKGMPVRDNSWLLINMQSVCQGQVGLLAYDAWPRGLIMCYRTINV